MSRGQSTTRLTRSASKALENYVSPAKRTKMGDDVTPPPPPRTPCSNVIVLDGESGVDHYEKGVGKNTNFPAQQLSTKGTTRFKLPQTVSYSEEDVKLAHYIFAEDLPPDEPLVQTMMEVYSRKTLWSLCPD
ncbi:unnamed protein product, partial [Linum tenue]